MTRRLRRLYGRCSTGHGKLGEVFVELLKRIGLADDVHLLMLPGPFVSGFPFPFVNRPQGVAADIEISIFLIRPCVFLGSLR